MRKSIITCLLLIIGSGASAQQYGWSVIATPRPGYYSSAVEFIDTLHGWCNPGGLIYRTTDGGFTWAPCQGQTLANSAISMIDSLHGWATDYYLNQTEILHTTDGGIHWVQQRFVYQENYVATAAQNIHRNTTVGNTYQTNPDTGKIISTRNAGQSWSERTPADSIVRFRKIQFVDSLHGWTNASVSNRLGLLRTIDGGQTWTLDTNHLGFGVFSFVDTSRGFAYMGNYGSGFIIGRTRDGGVSWETNPVPISNMPSTELIALSFVDTLDGWLFGSTFYQGTISEMILRTSDGGHNWVEESIGLTADILDGLMVDHTHGWAVTFDGHVLSYGITTGIVEKLPGLPNGFALRQNYPNPFNSGTNIEYEVCRRSDVRITVFNALGEKITALVTQIHEPGIYRIRFDGSRLGSGVYFYRMEAESFAETKQLLLIK